ncbi:hypothetical protein [Streptomyces sp. NPDC101115]|uniref:hypothetical protein n=1 Tax=Streptomyces sp. NPDC101115 TaxID=3366106 RepID=UPI0037F7A508
MNEWNEEVAEQAKTTIGRWLVQQGLVDEEELPDYADALDELATDLVNAFESAHGM